jgi:anti-sigma regulatory factor (Ser/Thr protein kinase)
VRATKHSERCLERTTFPGTSRAVRTARHRLLDFLDDAVSEDTSVTAGLLATELATNAVMHAGTEFTLSADLAPGSLRVGVEDGSDDLPAVRSLPRRELGGRGLHLVKELSSRWGADTLPSGKRVWFELPRW